MKRCSTILSIASSIFFLGSNLFAQQQGPAAPSSFEMLILPIGLLAIMYFLVFLPQKRKAKEHEKLLTGLKVGDEVFTSGGIVGRVRSQAEQFVTLEVSGGGSLKVLKNHVTGLTKSL